MGLHISFLIASSKYFLNTYIYVFVYVSYYDAPFMCLRTMSPFWCVGPFSDDRILQGLKASVHGLVECSSPQPGRNAIQREGGAKRCAPPGAGQRSGALGRWSNSYWSVSLCRITITAVILSLDLVTHWPWIWWHTVLGSAYILSLDLVTHWPWIW